VRGCFWHQHRGCIDSHIPRSGASYWRPKLRGNVHRDAQNLKKLKKLGYLVLVIWECQTKKSRANQLHLRIRKFFAAKSI
jgi:DNA mismatch endonuclease (patch repair protein)